VLAIGLDGAVLGLCDTLTLELGVLTLWVGETLALRLGDKLAIALVTAPPHPAVRHPVRIAVTRKRL
jgi:hypothetical protein